VAPGDGSNGDEEGQTKSSTETDDDSKVAETFKPTTQKVRNPSGCMTKRSSSLGCGLGVVKMRFRSTNVAEEDLLFLVAISYVYNLADFLEKFQVIKHPSRSRFQHRLLAILIIFILSPHLYSFQMSRNTESHL